MALNPHTEEWEPPSWWLGQSKQKVPMSNLSAAGEAEVRALEPSVPLRTELAKYFRRTDRVQVTYRCGGLHTAGGSVRVGSAAYH